jgi:hypothetical protein
VVFPECATTGYFVADRLRELAEPPDGRSSRRLSEIARTNGIHLAVGLISIEIWPDAASAENAFRSGLATWENDPHPLDAPVVY